MKIVQRGLVILLVVLSLAGCKVDLYNGLAEGEANEMLALLMLHNISANKEPEKGGKVGLKVERDHFITAVELLRQNGYPRKSYATVDQLFPSNQLVTSPVQEQAKMVYLKEQQLESMLSHMDGVIHADVTIAMVAPTDGKVSVPSSASVFIKFSPEVNLASYSPQIKSLVQDAVPGVAYEKISVLIQPANFRFSAQTTPAKSTHSWNLQWLLANATMVQSIFAVLGLLIIALIFFGWTKYLRK
ncbi:type III secretion apparatus lipoprotein, YscJ/HrcJ family [Candidatus Regiella insecticola 5.15]|uniref:Lipoprotein n=1 Tax=Candidatus Regiella insecticola 5.15 TaxID=1005043 RepID=G2GWP1_9ENTR|nr:type III secretion inner membrane ring lipoprotein SctJ [Candidatus Regiella insecticola]EGY29853.1 type III secretion apparatus lipoprotein, YscJ/HrcJ family [Candidatus Regiella insecticola 5.15]